MPAYLPLNPKPFISVYPRLVLGFSNNHNQAKACREILARRAREIQRRENPYTRGRLHLSTKAFSLDTLLKLKIFLAGYNRIENMHFEKME
jgi:hypothetical protein